MDTNAHNPLWNSSNSDDKGRELEEIIAEISLNICNSTSDLFRNLKGTTHVDVTLAGDEAYNNMREWQYLMIPSLSDHLYIMFILYPNRRKFNQQSPNRLPNLEQINFPIMSSTLKTELSSLIITDDLPTTTERIEEVNLFTECIRRSALKCRIHQSHVHRKLPYWNKQLYGLRSKLRKAQSIFQNNPINENCLTVQILKSSYQREIRKVKWDNWKTFCTENFNNDVDTTLRKLSNKKIRTLK